MSATFCWFTHSRMSVVLEVLPLLPFAAFASSNEHTGYPRWSWRVDETEAVQARAPRVLREYPGRWRLLAQRLTLAYRFLSP